MSDEREFYVDDREFGDLAMNWEMAVKLCFSDEDYYERKAGEAHPEVRKQVLEWYDDKDMMLTYLYAPAEKVRRRMAMQGYTPEKCKALWEREFARHIADGARMRDLGYEDFNREIDEQRGLSFEQWVIRQRQLGPNHVRRWNGVHLFSFTDMFADLALTIDVFKPNVVWTEFTSALEDFDPRLSFHENLAREPIDLGLDFIEATGDVLILTEGTSDTKILSAAIRALYPEFADMFQFVDFEEFKIEGGASLVSKMVKTFAGVRMTQRVLALFDNDVAGTEEKAMLDRTIRLPPSIRTMVLPDVALAAAYPTLGPEGLRSMDVNGSACSIELFLGREALEDESGELRPIRWTGWNKAARRYQGELDNKNAATQFFLGVLKSGGDPKELRARFPEMDGLLQAIFKAFG